MSLSVVDIAAFVAAGALAGSKLLTITQPLWAKVPKWLGVALPVLVLDLPQVGDAFGLVHTGVDLTTALLTSVALLLPGIAQAEAVPAPVPAAPVAPTPTAKA